ncbi:MULTISPECIES: anthranilate synthase component I family protein [unclassified Streptomyces]|uniref:anthranilate synthase component I family protein n=1 Tax=unclassified Streptomyces TaxID=2593676 RepID=UPI001F48D6BD|nr:MULTISPECIES: anthranilate synthase component I family protein [unclassified Streptomyces]MCU4748045.1 anthranilate synthase component I family protein [Streptomyces sp. G-5]
MRSSAMSMPDSEPIRVRVTSAGLPPHDPLDLWTRLRETRPADDVFLLEQLENDGGRRSAVVGYGRLAELRVYGAAEGGGGRLEITGVPALRDALAALARRHGMDAAPDGARFGDPRQVWDVLAAVQGLFAVDTEQPPDRYAFGFLTTLAYESAWLMEELPPRTKPPHGPDLTLALFRDTVRYDGDPAGALHLHAESEAFPAAPAGEGTPPLPPPPLTDGRGVPDAPRPRAVRDSVSRDTFLGWAERCLEHIRVGDIYQIQIGHRVDVQSDLTPRDVYRRLRARNPSPYMYLAPRAGGLLIGASPELHLRIEAGEITMRPIAGTTPRGPDDAENQRRVKELRASTKERAEHVMLVDLCRNDLSRVAVPSTRPVENLMEVETFSHVFHLVSTVTGRLAPGTGVWDAIRATFPAGTMTGAPKIRAMEIIDGLEKEARGAYAGAVGLLDARGTWSELALCIRTVAYDGATYSTQTSAGLVAQSDPAAEWRETLAKMGAAHWALTGEELL